MIKGRCTTKIEDYIGDIWPSLFCKVPDVGEKVLSNRGHTLKVTGITHCQKESFAGDLENEPYVIIELG